jgi:hypothetical protein
MTPLQAPITPFPFPYALPLQQVQATVVAFVIAGATPKYLGCIRLAGTACTLVQSRPESV